MTLKGTKPSRVVKEHQAPDSPVKECTKCSSGTMKFREMRLIEIDSHDGKEWMSQSCVTCYMSHSCETLFGIKFNLINSGECKTIHTRFTINILGIIHYYLN